MKLILQYDPWAERRDAQRAADAMKTLGIPVELVEVRVRSLAPQPETPEPIQPVKFDPAP